MDHDLELKGMMDHNLEIMMPNKKKDHANLKKKGNDRLSPNVFAVESSKHREPFAGSLLQQ